MCGRYILVHKIEFLEKRFQAAAPPETTFSTSYNIAAGNYAPVIINQEGQNKLQLFRFGLTPSFSKKSKLFINARAEGDHNQENNPVYRGACGIINKPAFRKPIRSQRCLIPADAFIEGTSEEKLSKPYLVYLRNKVRPFAFAGIWDSWRNPANDELIFSFSIITTTSNNLIQRIPHHRSPVILPAEAENQWLNHSLPLSEITALLLPYPARLMNAYPIAPTIKNPEANDPALIRPVGERIMPEYSARIKTKLKQQGMGNPKKSE